MVRRSNDHELTIGSDTQQLVLARDAKGVPAYSVIEQEAAPEILTYLQNNWQGGFGQLNWEDPLRYAEGEGIDTSHSGVVFLGPKLNAITGANSLPVRFISFGGGTYLATTTKVFVYSTTFVLKKDFTAIGTITDMVVYKNVLYIALGSTVKYYYTTDGTTYTQTTLTDGFAVKFLVAPNAARTADVLWKSKLPNEISQTTDGQVGGVQWASPNYIGETTQDILSLMLFEGNLLVGKEDGLFLFDSAGGVTPLMLELALDVNARNWFSPINSGGRLYAGMNDRIVEFSSLTSYRIIDPFSQAKGIDVRIRLTGLSADLDNLYAAYGLVDGLDYAVYKGVEVDGSWRWHPWIKVASDYNLRDTGLSVLAGTAWVLSETNAGGVKAYYITLQDNPLAWVAVGQLDVQTGGYFRTSYLTAPARLWQKFLLSVITETEACTAARTITLKYRKDTETNFTAATAAITTNGIVQTYLTNALNFKRIQIEVDFATDAATATPVLRHLELRGVTIPEVIRVYDVTYHIGQSKTLRAKTIRDFLRTGRTTTSLIKFADLRYNETTLTGTAYHYVMMLPGYPQEVEVVHEKDTDPEMGIRCRFVEVDFPEA